MRKWLSLICIVYITVCGLYNVTTPPFESADEVWHYPVVHHLANNGLRLPVLDTANPLPWRQQAAQPPLYYLLAALITMPIDTSDFEQVWRLNPHDLGIQVADEVPNAVVHNAERERWPWSGTLLALHLARGLSTLFGLGTVLVTYATARTLFPERPQVALGASALTAFLPMFVLLSASVSNDSLALFTSNLALLVLLRVASGVMPANWRTYALLGLVVGIGLLSKLSTAFLIPLVALVLARRSWQARNPRIFLIGGLVSGSLTIAVAGWWYWYNWLTYGDPTALNVFLDVVGRHEIDLHQLWLEHDTLVQSTWGFVGAIYAPMPAIVYAIFNAIALVGLLGGLAYWVAARRRKWAVDNWLLAIAVLWGCVTFGALIRWSLTTPAWQGRLLFGALSVYAVWIALGLTWWWPRRWRVVPLLVASGYFLLVTSAAPFALIIPAFAPPPPLALAADAELLSTFQRHEEQTEETFTLALYHAELSATDVQPGDNLRVALDWSVEQPTDDDWSLFIHLVNPEGVIIAQRDLYPGRNRMATSDLAQGRTWRENAMVPLPASAYAPQQLEVRVGWYQRETGERLVTPIDDTYHTVGSVELSARTTSSGLPNPVAINFDNQITLMGYELDGLSADGGEVLTLTLYWQAQNNIELDYTVFANLIEPHSLRKAADSNAMPANWQRPTSSWQVGDVIVDTHTLTIYADAQPDIYTIEVGLYVQADGQFIRLDRLDDAGIVRGDVAYLTRVRVKP